MASGRSSPEFVASGPREFRTTHWSVVLGAGDAASPQSAEALERLCRAYWLPLYAYVRRRGRDPEDAQDLTQAFFKHFLENNAVSRADRQRGRFRSFLLICRHPETLNVRFNKAYQSIEFNQFRDKIALCSFISINP